jgi:hypothetical protein
MNLVYVSHDLSRTEKATEESNSFSEVVRVINPRVPYVVRCAEINAVIRLFSRAYDAPTSSVSDAGPPEHPSERDWQEALVEKALFWHSNGDIGCDCNCCGGTVDKSV